MFLVETNPRNNLKKKSNYPAKTNPVHLNFGNPALLLWRVRCQHKQCLLHWPKKTLWSSSFWWVAYPKRWRSILVARSLLKSAGLVLWRQTSSTSLVWRWATLWFRILVNSPSLVIEFIKLHSTLPFLAECKVLAIKWFRSTSCRAICNCIWFISGNFWQNSWAEEGSW